MGLPSAKTAIKLLFFYKINAPPHATTPPLSNEHTHTHIYMTQLYGIHSYVKNGYRERERER